MASKKKNRFQRYLMTLKNGVISGAADNDPSGIVTYTQAGALAGLTQLWLIFIMTPMLIVVQDMAARLGVVAKKGLNVIIKDRFSKYIAWPALVILIVCNTATIGADMAAIAAIIEQFTGIHFLWFVVPIGILFYYMLVKQSYKMTSLLLYIVAPVLLVYVIVAFMSHPAWLSVIKATFTPTIKFDAAFISSAVGLLGTTITPFLIYWQAREEIEEEKHVAQEVEERTGVRFGMIYSNVVAYFVVLTSGLVLHGHIRGNINTWGPADAAAALKPLVGSASSILFALGIVAAGVMAVPVLAMVNSYTVEETVRGKEQGMEQKPSRAKRFYGVIALSLAAGATLSLFGVKPMAMLYYSQVLNGCLMPVLLLLLVIVTSDKTFMGEHANGWPTKIIAWLTVAFMTVFALTLIYKLIFG